MVPDVFRNDPGLTHETVAFGLQAAQAAWMAVWDVLTFNAKF